ncbi:hypothetical protein [Pseudomonas syringae]
MTAHSFIYAKYPALQSKRALALFWVLIATLAIAATFSGPPPFLPEGFSVDERYFSDNMQLLAVVFCWTLSFGGFFKATSKTADQTTEA